MDAFDCTFEYILYNSYMADKIFHPLSNFPFQFFSHIQNSSSPFFNFYPLPDLTGLLFHHLLPPLLSSNVFLLSPGGRQLPALWRFGLCSLLSVSRQQAVHAGKPLQWVHQWSALPSLLPPWSGEVPVLLQQIALFGWHPCLAEREWVNGSVLPFAGVSAQCAIGLSKLSQPQFCSNPKCSWWGVSKHN